MDRFDLVDKLVKSTGVRYEDAKNALDASGWDILDAAVRLEKEGKTTNKSARMDTAQENETDDRNTNTAFNGVSNSRGSNSDNRVFNFLKTVFMENSISFYKPDGETFLEIPIWLMLILFLVAFWPVLFAVLLFFCLGYRFRFNGPVLGNKAVNNILYFIENAGEMLFQKLKKLSQKTSSNHDSSQHQDVKNCNAQTNSKN